MSCFRTVPEFYKLLKAHVVIFIFPGKVNEQKCNAALAFKIFHENHLVFMDVGNGKCAGMAFLGIKTYRDPLDGANIVHGRALFKISQRNMPALFINIDRFNGRWDLLDQRQTGSAVALIGQIDHFLQLGSSKAS